MTAKDNSLDIFTRELASSAPTPGGGGAAALCAALSASLCSMAASLTAGKKRFAEYAADYDRMLCLCESLRAEALHLIDEDARLFAPLSKLYSMPKDTEGYAEMLEEATLSAVSAPLSMLDLCAKISELLCELYGKCSALLLSDVGCGASLCLAAMRCAAMNVFVNTRCLKDKDRAAEINSNVAEIVEKHGEKLSELERIITDKLRSE